MQFPICVQRFEELSGVHGELHLAIGVFDGVHLGHKAVIESAVFSARGSEGVSAVLTFDPHPSRLFRPDAATELMMNMPSKVAMLHQLGVDVVICKQFDHPFASIPADAFLAHLKTELPSLKSIYIGQNFRFGQKRLGDVATLVQSGKALGIDVFSIDRIQHNGEAISSTRIRKELEAGEIGPANDLLGYNYSVSGVVVGGAKFGREIGFPTLNLPWDPECRPRYGVYYVRYREVGHTPWQAGVANYGVKPTVDDTPQSPVLETHALGDCSLGEGSQIEVEWLQFIRAEQKFASIDALVAQISKDRERALEWSRANNV